MMNRFPLFVWLSLLLISTHLLPAQHGREFWQAAKSAELDPTSRDITPQEYRTFQLDLTQMRSLLSQAPHEKTFSAKDLVVSLPDANGNFQRYAIRETNVLHPDIAARYPMIKTFVGRGIDERTSHIRLDVTEHGFHAQIRFTHEGTVYIDPYNRQTTSQYMVYLGNDQGLDPDNLAAACGLDDNMIFHDRHEPGSVVTRNSTGSNLLTYRFAVAADVLYSTFHGGSVSSVMSALATAVNGINGIFEVDFSIRFEIIPTNDQLIFLTNASDPYSQNGNPASMINENQGIVDSRVGFNSYDVGHAFTDLIGGSGVAGIAQTPAACGGGKARGISANFTPAGPSFIRVAAHELGHMFNANHIFNTNDNSCFGNRRAIAAYEPGGGSTVMSYAGACVFNLQGDGDDYFNVANYDEVYRFGHIGSGATCATVSPTGNTPPVVDAGPSGMVIPIQTPFELTASGTDADGDALTYCWEQHDLGPAGNPNTPEGNAPIFRSFSPTSNPTRVFPRLQNLLNNTTVFGETYPTYTRDLSFRATVRDNNPAGGGLNYDEITMEVTDQAGPFLVTYPNDPEAFTGGDVIEIAWDPANTQLAPVDCDSVDIFLSVDAGFNYQFLLKESTPNDGRARVILPDTTVGQIRIKVKAANNVFFDISNRNSSITASGRQDIVSFFEEDELAVCLGGDTTLSLQTAGLGGVTGKVTGRATGVPNGIQVNLPGDSVAIGDSYSVNVAADAGLAPGSYTFRILLAGTGGVSELKTIEIQVLDNEAAVVETIGDPSGEQFLSSLPGVAWEPLTGARSYTLQVATSPSFDAASMVLNISNYEATQYRFTDVLPANDIYYWRVAANTVCGLTAFSIPTAFRIGECTTYSPQDLPQNIDANSPNAIRSSVNISDPGSIADVNILKIEGTHSAFNELIMSLSKVGGPSVELIDQICTQREAEFKLSFDDESPEGLVDCLPEDGFSFRPAENLSAFDGLAAAGEYELVVQDVLAGDGGELQSWALQVCFTEPNAPIVVRNTPLEIKQFKSDFINQSLLRIISPGSAASDVVYVAVTSPSFGSLRLNGNPLGPGDTFTQADLDGNSIEYFQNGTLVEADSFLFTVEVAGRSWLGLQTFNIIIEDNTSTNLADELGLEVFPNPTRDEVTVRLAAGNEASLVAVYNLAGQRIAEAQLEAGAASEVTLNLGQHPTGLYLVKVQTGNKVVTKQIRRE